MFVKIYPNVTEKGLSQTHSQPCAIVWEVKTDPKAKGHHAPTSVPVILVGNRVRGCFPKGSH